MTPYITYYRVDGMICRQKHFDVPDAEDPEFEALDAARDAEIAALIPDGGGYAEGYWDDMVWYFPAGVPAARPVIDVASSHEIAADGVAAVAFAIPAGTKIHFENGRLVADGDDDFVFTTSIPGTYDIRVNPPLLWVPKVITVRAS